MKRLAVTSLGVALVILACSGERTRPDEVEGPFTWGGVSNVTHFHDLWFSGQPDEEALREAKANGIQVVLNLRDPSELDWDERGAVEALGMTYYSVPVQGRGPFMRKSFSRIEALVKEHEGEEILIHCSSSNRVGGWFATHLVEEHGMGIDDALAFGQWAGITRDSTAARVRAYLAETKGE
jgi:protein tyrosine phosphatase (PTP) superfamily phosphohydrolase (DUF442 family)